MIYFDNAATTLPKPPCVPAAVLQAMTSFGNASRGAHSPSLAAGRTLLEARETLARLFGVGDSSRVAFCHNGTAALNIAIAGISGHIVTTAAEHNSVLRPIHCRGNYTVVPCDHLGLCSPDAILAAIQPDTGAVVMTHASNLTGNVYDIGAVGAACRERGVLLIVDAAQSAGLLPIHLEHQGISALCFTGHKSLFGPQGTGGICLAEDFSPPPLAVGGSGSHSFQREHPTLLPDRLEAGTENAHGVAGLLAGVQYIEQTGREAIFRQVSVLSRRFLEGVRRIPGITLYGDVDAEIRVPVVALNIEHRTADEVAFRLDREHGIAVRAGIHCAPLMHTALGTAERGAVRFSFSHLNTADQIDTALAALRSMA